MFGSFFRFDLQTLGPVIVLALVPAIIWMGFIFKGRKTSRGTLLLAFFLGTLTVLPIMGLEYLWVWFPELDVYSYIDKSIHEAHLLAFVTLVVAAMLEELFKSGVVRFIGRTKIGIHTINDAVKYSILAGLGFSFIENIFYFYFIWRADGLTGLLFPMIFRSTFTMAAHMVFSGLFGYFYGIAKFARPILETKIWMGERASGIKVYAKLFNTNEADAFRQIKLLEGLFIAMILHAFFNFFLEFEMFAPVVIIVGVGFAYLMYLLAHKAGAIVFAGRGGANINIRDEDVVLELLGMWTNEGRYKDVIDICNRLLSRDPNNKVVKLFQARAMDKQKLDRLETTFTSLFTKDEMADEESIDTLVKRKVLMDMKNEVEAQIAAQQKATGPGAPAPSIPAPGSAAANPVQVAPAAAVPADTAPSSASETIPKNPPQTGSEISPSNPAQAMPASPMQNDPSFPPSSPASPTDPSQAGNDQTTNG